MQKISGILPSSARVTTVDLKETGGARPGAPSFGRPMGESNLLTNSIVRSAHRALASHNQLMDKRTREQEHADEIQKLADNFFKSKAQITRGNDLVDTALIDRAMNIGAAPTVEIPVTEEKSFSEMSEEEVNAPDIGRHIDVVV